MDQGEFEFAERRAARFPSEHPLVILRWIEVGTDGQGGKVEAWWPEFEMVTWFRNWREALPIVLHETNSHVQVKVRATSSPAMLKADPASLLRFPYQRSR